MRIGAPAMLRMVLLMLTVAGSACALNRAPALIAECEKAESGWKGVTALDEGARVRVTMRATGEMVSGRLTAVGSEAIAMRRGQTEQVIDRTAIARVAVMEHQPGVRAVRGLVIGGVAGVALGALATETNRLSWAAFFGAAWGALGTTIGAVDGLISRTEMVVYDAGHCAP